MMQILAVTMPPSGAAAASHRVTWSWVRQEGLVDVGRQVFSWASALGSPLVMKIRGEKLDNSPHCKQILTCPPELFQQLARNLSGTLRESTLGFSHLSLEWRV